MKPHPWGDFLKARYYAIHWMRDEQGYSDALIAHKLSMDEQQVYLIRTGLKFWELIKEEQD